MLTIRMVVRFLIWLMILCCLTVSPIGCKSFIRTKPNSALTFPVLYNAENNGLSAQVNLPNLLKLPQTKLVLLDFWATWDKPKTIQVNAIEDIFEKNKDKGLVVLGVSLDSAEMPKNRILDYMNNVTYPLIWDKDNLLKEQYSISTVPTQILIDKDNKIVFQYSGLSQEGFDNLSNKVSNLLP
jgi:peroxiredoxin